MKRHGYQAEVIGRWNVFFENATWDGTLQHEVRRVLHIKLAEAEQVLPHNALSRLQAKVRLYVDMVTDDHTDVAVYHGLENGPWLETRSEPADKAGSINICNSHEFCKLASNPRAYPAVLLHEIAHAFHNLVLDDGFNNRIILAVFNSISLNGKYKSVLNVTGDTHDSNALSDHREYFANTTVAYFDKNDDYPFNRQELAEYDPEGFRLIQEVWT